MLICILFENWYHILHTFIAYKWTRVKDKTIENVFVLDRDPIQGCEEISVLCFWKDLKIAKSKCKKWFKCGMLKETKDLSGLKLFWAVKIGASQKDIKHSIQDNIWMMDKIGNHLMYFLMNDVCSNYTY